MRNKIKQYWRTFSESLYRQYVLTFSLIALVVIAVVVPALWISNLSSGSGGAINVSGSLRMQSYKLALAVADPFESNETRKVRISEAIKEFDTRLHNENLYSASRFADKSDVFDLYLLVEKRFNDTITPLASSSVESEDAQKLFLDEIANFVHSVDLFVLALEEDLDQRFFILKSLLLLIMLGALGLTALVLLQMKKTIFTPLSRLSSIAHAVSNKDFSQRSHIKARNEIGQLSGTFDFMMDELSDFYASLESKVAAQTLDLNRRTKGLVLLNELAGMNWENLTTQGERGLSTWLDRLAQMLDVKAIVILKTPLATLTQTSFEALIDKKHCFSRSQLNTSINAKDAKFNYPMKGDQKILGEVVLFQHEEPLSDWQETLALAVAQQLSKHFLHQEKILEDRRLAVLEERNTIARELHDSIAQSLSFSRIQVLRLKRALSEPNREDAKVSEILDELSLGIKQAYRQIREVLTAFRVQLKQGDFSDALIGVIDEFSNRTGLTIDVDSNLQHLELNPNEQIHVVQILHEALMNIEKHAQAKSIKITIDARASHFRMLVQDDGVGFDQKAREKFQHFGLSMMSERALAVHGSVSIDSVPGQGTCLQLVIPYQRENQ